MENKVLEAVRRWNMLVSGDSVTVGISGGADSSALLCALVKLRDELGITVYACHVNHNLRGEESDCDERFACALCERFGVPVEVFSADIAGSALKGESTEETARRVRYGFFDEICEKNGSKLATAHTADDSAETVLFNLMRGTGTRGLVGIPPVRERIIRPLILCTRADTEEYCRKNGIEFVTDSSNLSDDYTRNRIRHRLIPLIKEFNPSFTDAVSRMSAAAAQDDAFISEYAADCAEEIRRGSGYSSTALLALPDAVRFRIIAETLKKGGVEPSALRVSQCEELLKKGYGRVNLKKNRFAVVKKKVFFILAEEQHYRERH